MDDVVDIDRFMADVALTRPRDPVREVRCEPVGTGQTASTYRLALDEPNLPTLIAKVAVGDEESREFVAARVRERSAGCQDPVAV